MNEFRMILGASMLVLLMACASSQGRKTAKDIPYPDAQSPEWIGEPKIKGGMAATECAEDNAPRSILKRKTSVMARATLTEELRAGVDSLARAQTKQAESDGGSSWSKEFLDGVNQAASETLVNSRVARSDYVTTRGKTEYCTMVVIEKETFAQLKADIARAQNEDSHVVGLRLPTKLLQQNGDVYHIRQKC
jgi:hypothetical protein